jgi:phage terminase large subunit-like protein
MASLPNLSDPSQTDLLLKTLSEEKTRRFIEDKLKHYRPYDKQLEFHNAGANYRERLLMAANQVGKTYAAAMELAAHCTGEYPAWWQGYRFDHAIHAWACGETSEVVRATIQLLLLGEPGQHGTGCIPKASLLEVVPARGVADLADMIRVQHVSGEVSTISLKAYAQGREKFQGATISYLWLDEEPDQQIFTEALTRTNIARGPVILTFTPLKGMSNVVKRYLLEKSPDRHVTTMTLDDASHYSEQDKQRIIAQYPEHEKATRTRGVPQMGSGRVFLVPEEKLLVDPFECPKHWVKIGGLDPGWTHFAAFCELWWDRDLDCIYLVRTLRLREQTVLQHVNAVRSWRLKWAWPHDGRNATLAGAGIPLARQYADAGLDMLPEKATFEEGGMSVEAGVAEMHDRMRSDRWKVFKGQNDDWLEEYGLYFRKDGLLVKENDDALSASRYALMMKRFGQSAAFRTSFNRKIEYPRLGIA